MSLYPIRQLGSSNSLEIQSLLVTRQGIAQKLLNHVFSIELSASIYRVTTGCENKPAVRFYSKNGFHKYDKTEIAKDVWLGHFEKKHIASIHSKIRCPQHKFETLDEV